MQHIFFLFGQREVTRLAVRLEAGRLSAIPNAVVTCLPGIDTRPLERLAEAKDIALLPLEECLACYGITQMTISEAETDLILTLLSAKVADPALEAAGLGTAIGIRAALLNLIGLLIHNSVAFEMVFEKLHTDGMIHAFCFDPGGRFALIERLDVSTLIRPGLMMGPHLRALCEGSGVRFTRVGPTVPGLTPATNALRNLLLRTYKMVTLVRRSRSHKPDPIPAKADGHTVLFVVRADTEVSSARPMIEILNARDHTRALLFVDDLLKSPTATRAVAGRGLEWVHAHGKTRPGEVLLILAIAWFRTNRAVRGILLRHQELGTPLDRFGFLGSTQAAQSILKTAMASVPELVLFARQLDLIVAQSRPKALVSFDTVDRWGAVQGAVAARHSVPTLMFQNTALDRIRYPLPLATDHLIVANKSLRDLMLNSGASPDNVHASGLPQHDRMIQAGDERLTVRETALKGGKLAPLRVLVATQPFVQTFDYNGQLLDDLTAALAKIDLSAEIIVKPHPREAAGSYAAIIATLQKSGQTARLLEGDFDAALDAADIVVSRTSTSLQLSAVGGLPSISYLRDYPVDIVTRLDYLKDPVVDKYFSLGDLSNALTVFTDPIGYAKQLTDFAARRRAYLAAQYPGGKRATAAAMDLLCRIANLRDSAR